jgi:hypothetical protein
MRLVGERIGFDTNAKIVYHLLLSSSSNLSLFLSFSSLLLLLFFLGVWGLALLAIKHYGYAKEVHFGTTAEERSRQALGDDANIIHVEIGTSLHT